MTLLELACQQEIGTHDGQRGRWKATSPARGAGNRSFGRCPTSPVRRNAIGAWSAFDSRRGRRSRMGDVFDLLKHLHPRNATTFGGRRGLPS